MQQGWKDELDISCLRISMWNWDLLCMEEDDDLREIYSVIAHVSSQVTNVCEMPETVDWETPLKIKPRSSRGYEQYHSATPSAASHPSHSSRRDGLCLMPQYLRRRLQSGVSASDHPRGARCLGDTSTRSSSSRRDGVTTQENHPLFEGRTSSVGEPASRKLRATS